MAKMRDMDVRAVAVEKALEALKDGSFMNKAEQAGAKTYAYPVEIDIDGNGELTEVWVTNEMVCKSWKPYKTKYGEKPAYNPFEVQREYEADLEAKRIEAEAKAKAKADKLKAKGKAVPQTAEKTEE
jgi:hypothetical protein